MSTIAERVAAGAAFLDEHDPEWWRADVERAIDLDKLKLSSPQKCILGQRCPLEARSLGNSPFEAFARQLSGLDRYHAIGNWATAFGFESSLGLDGEIPEGEYGNLTAEWVRVITARRAAS